MPSRLPPRLDASRASDEARWEDFWRQDESRRERLREIGRALLEGETPAASVEPVAPRLRAARRSFFGSLVERLRRKS